MDIHLIIDTFHRMRWCTVCPWQRIHYDFFNKTQNTKFFNSNRVFVRFFCIQKPTKSLEMSDVKVWHQKRANMFYGITYGKRQRLDQRFAEFSIQHKKSVNHKRNKLKKSWYQVSLSNLNKKKARLLSSLVYWNWITRVEIKSYTMRTRYETYD